MEPFSPRRIRFSKHLPHGPWTLKLYSIVHGDHPIDWPSFEPGLRLARNELPGPAIENGRPGLGFIIAHAGRTADYVVLGWWDNENELPLRVWVRTDPRAAWRPAQGSESICVWDLEVIWAERQAWVDTMLTPDGGGRAAWVDRVDPSHRD